MRAIVTKLLLLLAALLPLASTASASVQTPVDRADPSVIEEELRNPKRGLGRNGPKTPLQIEPAQDEESVITRPVAVRFIRIEGGTEVAAAAFRPAVEPFLGRTLGSRELSALASAVADVARRSGYGLATAWIPEQTVEGGLLRVALDEGRIQDVKILGADADAPVRRVLAPLANGRPVRTADLERRLLLAGDLPGMTVSTARLERLSQGNLLIVEIKVEETKARILIDNWGSRAVGPVRAHLSVDFNGLLADDDRLTVGGVVTPLSPKEFGLIRLAYSKVLNAAGTEVTVGGYAARSRPGGVLRAAEFEGRSLEASVGVSHPFVRTRATSLWGDLEFSLRDAEQSRRDVTVRDDRLALIRASSFLTAKVGGGRARARVTLTRGLGLLGATREGDRASSRADGSGIFSKAEFWADYSRRLAGPFSVQAQAEGQVASRALLSSEEYGLGGRYFLRGYDYRELSGDNGIAGSIELRLDLPKLGGPVEEVQLYGYADAGSVGNLDGGLGGGALYSAGGGIRAWLQPDIEASLEVGVPLRRIEPDQELDPRISFLLGRRF
jgi:hemolysin activation/secretion protein